MAVTDILNRWEVLLDLLRSQVEGGSSPEIVEQTRERVRRFAQDVDQREVPLTYPAFDDPAFKGLHFGHPGKLEEDARFDEGDEVRREIPGGFDEINIPVFQDYTDMSRYRMELERLLTGAIYKVKGYRAALRKVDREYKKLLFAQATGTKYRPGMPRKPLRPGPCWDGCGRMTKLKRNKNDTPVRVNRYIGNHMVRYTQLVMAVERYTGQGHRVGPAMRYEDLPKLLKNKIRWIRCELCGGWIPNIDPWGREIEEKIGLLCWRDRKHVVWPYKKKRDEPEAG